MLQSTLTLNTISEAIEDLKNGKVIIVVDDENRENEGDFITAAETITADTVNFMTMYGRGLICTPITQKRASELDLDFMVGRNTDPKETAFTVSVDRIGHGVTTGISASDRAITIKALTESERIPADFARPGHVFPLIAKKGGVLKRDGHTEACVDLLKLAGMKPAGVLIEIMNEDGTMARLPQLVKIAEKFDLKIITIKDLIAYRLKNDTLVKRTDESDIHTFYGDFKLISYLDKTNNQTHFALVKGNVNTEDEIIPVRVSSTNAYFDLFNMLAKGEKNLMQKIVDHINLKEKGAIIFINNTVSPIQITKKFDQFKSFIAGESNSPSIPVDNRDLGIGAQIIKDLGIKKIQLLTQSLNKNIPLSSGYGLKIADIFKL